ncbi:uncharacterized protein LOC115806987 [Chanos chanos]|uniref:Uncharacterized protein LOC115806987 n=1 Tax=Chanos chanos TaxID=29144 RepID=A0A6J2UTA3_CHACN|nr:uncharacterized protein LOC115806987 [Chanos chanos]
MIMCLYSSSSQLSVHTPTPPTPVRQVNRIREKVKKSPSPRNYLPKVRLTLRHYRDPESNRARLRRPSEPVQSRSPDSPEFLNLTNEKSVGLVTGCDVNALLKSAIDKTDLGVHPANSTGQPLLSYRGKIDLNQQYKVKSQRSPDSTYIRNQINQGTIKLIQPVSYTWTELDWTQHLQNRVLRDRIMTGTKLQSGVRGHHCSATPWTNRSGNTPSTQLLKWTSPMGNPKTLKRDRETT